MKQRIYVKLRVDMYEDTKFKIIDTMEDRDLIHYIWTRLLALAGKVNLEGNLYMSKNIPYTVETLSIEFNRSSEKVGLALKVLQKLEMIELSKDGVYKVINFVKHQNIKVKEKSENINNKHIDIKPVDNNNICVKTVDNKKNYVINKEEKTQYTSSPSMILPLEKKKNKKVKKARNNKKTINEIALLDEEDDETIGLVYGDATLKNKGDKVVQSFEFS